MKWQLITPSTPAQWQSYYQLRYQVLRAPWQQPPGSERDELEQVAEHRMIIDSHGQALAVGRLHFLTPPDTDNPPLAVLQAQVRYMAVAEAARGQGLGAVVLDALEQAALAKGCQQIVLNARDSAVEFYRKAGYRQGAELPPLWTIPHWQMLKELQLGGSVAQWQQWTRSLQQTWHQTIPLSAFMQLEIASFDGAVLSCRAPLAPNKNLHHTMFAGSIYSLATLTGWGLIYLQLQALGLHGDIVLADGHIRYLAPLQALPCAKVRFHQARGCLRGLTQGRKVRQTLRVEIFDADQQVAEFTGKFVVVPALSAPTPPPSALEQA